MCSFLDSSDRLFIKKIKKKKRKKRNCFVETNEKEDYRVIPSHWKSKLGTWPLEITPSYSN